MNNRTTAEAHKASVDAETYPYIHDAFDTICEGSGGRCHDVYHVDPPWISGLASYEAVLRKLKKKLTAEEYETFLIGEETEMLRIAEVNNARRAVRKFLNAFFNDFSS